MKIKLYVVTDYEKTKVRKVFKDQDGAGSYTGYGFTDSRVFEIEVDLEHVEEFIFD